VLRLEDRWVWDSWLADDGRRYHLFFLQAPRSEGDPDVRHFQVSVGHAVSDDLRTWEVLPTALEPSPGPRWDDYTTWTGSVVRAPDRRWLMFYTGTSRAEDGLIQRIGSAESDDLLNWRRMDAPPLEADPRWYEKLDPTAWPDEAWRDPYVYPDPHGEGWHMLITARANSGPPDSRGVIGHARSVDLIDWQILEPLSEPGSFGHLEVPQAADVEGTPIVVFSCRIGQLPPERRDTPAGRPPSSTRASTLPVSCVTEPGNGIYSASATTRATASSARSPTPSRSRSPKEPSWN
jgi:beta-fructofuranosidase